MKIMKISDKTMFKGGESNKSHFYLIYKVRPRKKIKGDKGYRALQLNHLYLIDKKRLLRLKKGFYVKDKFKEFEVPSLIDKRVYTHSESSVLDFDNNAKYKTARKINNKQAEDILEKIKK